LRVCGVDDAGRGPVIGPLVIAGILIEEEKLDQLRSLGVKDSKKLSPEARMELSTEIPKMLMNITLSSWRRLIWTWW